MEDTLHHDISIAGMHHILEILPPETFQNVTRASVAFDIYQRVKGILEAYDVQIGQRVWEPSEN